MNERLKLEAAIALALLSFGVLVLPLAVYLVGVQVVGPYSEGEGMLDLATDVWTALGRREIAAWILVLAPYLVVQLARLTRLIWRSRPV